MSVFFSFINGAVSVMTRQAGKNRPGSQTGAVATFTGIVRNDLIYGSEVMGIEFTAHKDMAIGLCNELMKKYTTKYQLYHITVLHSLGFIKHGDDCFYVEVHAAHRKEAFKALAEIVDEFKSQVPVFGKELLINGEYVWKENKY